MGAEFAKGKGLESFTTEFEKGALIAKNPAAFESLKYLDEDDKVSSISFEFDGACCPEKINNKINIARSRDDFFLN